MAARASCITPSQRLTLHLVQFSGPAQLTIELVRGSDNFGRYDISFLNASGAVQASYLAIGSFSQTVSVPSAGVYYIQVSSYSFSDRQYSIKATFAPLVPTITTQPTDQNAITGSTVTFAVTANGIPPLSYQWRKMVFQSPGRQTRPCVSLL